MGLRQMGQSATCGPHSEHVCMKRETKNQLKILKKLCMKQQIYSEVLHVSPGDHNQMPCPGVWKGKLGTATE